MRSNFGNLRNQINKLNTSSFTADDRFWKLEPDANGNARAIIRFLPERTEHDLPFVRTFKHAFKGPTSKWFIEECPTTLGQECPVCSANSDTWAIGTEAAKSLVRERKRKLHYVANIMVVDDPKKPENNGKIFLFKFGKKIYDMIVDKVQPEYEDDTPINVFCPMTGADFDLRQRKVEGYPNYDKSVFLAPAPMFGGDEDQIDEFLKGLNDLNDLLKPSLFKSSEELERKFKQVIGNAGRVSAPVEEEYDTPPAVKEVPVTAPKARPLPTMSKDTEDEDDLAYFERLANM